MMIFSSFWCVQEASLEWSGYAQSYRKFKKMNNINSFRISVESLKEYCEFHKANVYLQARTKISIKVAVWKQPEPVNNQATVVEPASTSNSIVPSLEDEVYEEVDLFGTTSIHDPDLSKYKHRSTHTCTLPQKITIIKRAEREDEPRAHHLIINSCIIT